MLSNSPVAATLAVTDLERAKDFYSNMLGLEMDAAMSHEYGALYKAGHGTMIMLYPRENASTADNTQASFKVEDIEKEVEELSAKGVKFEHYDMPGIKTNEKGIAEMEGMKSAWLKDPDGNILGLMQA